MGLVLLAVAAGCIGIVYGRHRWARITAHLHARLDAVRIAPDAARVDFRELDALPTPVARYLRTVLRDGQPRLRSARFVQHGTFNLASDGERWLPFDAEQHVQVARPGFDWNARVWLAPGVPIRVHDAYADGTGSLRASLLGAVDVANLEGGGDVAEGELMRWLAEAPWYPTALLPGEGVQWRPIDTGSAEASVTDGDVRVALVFRFGEDGLVAAVHAPSRARTVGRRLVPTPWEGRFGGYAWRQGMRIPTEGEVGWHVDGAFRPYWRGRTLQVAYDGVLPDPGASGP